MKKSLFLALSIILFATSCSDDSDNGRFKRGQLIEVCIGLKLTNENQWISNHMKVPYNPIPQKEWPVSMKDNSSSDIYASSIICRIETEQGVFYHYSSMFDSSNEGHFFTDDAQSLYRTDTGWKTQLGTDIPEGFPCIDGWECIYYRWNNN